MSQSILKMEQIVKSFGAVNVLKGVDFDLAKGEVHALVGGNGAGKSTLMKIMTGVYTKDSGKIIIKGEEKEIKSTNDAKENGIAMIFQEPMSSLNPAMRIDKQMIEGIRLHTDLTKEQARERAAKILQQVGIPDPERVLKNYPHQLSGGMSQRVMIAMAMSCNPELLIADEPTTALDVTIPAQILDLMKKIQQEEGMIILLITHDLGVVAEMFSRVIVMYAGELVEEAPVDIRFNHPAPTSTVGLHA